MLISVLSLFPAYFDSPLSCSLIGRALRDGLLSVNLINLRDFASRRGGRVDDRPFGGGPGMVLDAPTVVRSVTACSSPCTRTVMLSPAGRPLNSRLVKELAKEEHLLLLSGHYEGVDARALDLCIDESISVGDFVLTNGCLAALVVIDAVSRFLLGVIGNDLSACEDSFENSILDFPHYTRPRSYLGYTVPEVLVSGHHYQVSAFRKERAVEETRRIRPDLFLSALGSSFRGKPLLIRYVDVSLSLLVNWYRALGFVLLETEYGLLASVEQISVHFVNSGLACFEEEAPSQLVRYVSEQERTSSETALAALSWPYVVSHIDSGKETLTCLRVIDPSGLNWLIVSGCYGG
ncbi:tRNA (guanosine(37)-N1)-methyltransferase TrmD [Candidatus Similichlamydia laticola]|uniref:tRNA (guanine-N(1)-)-methyltransferase n=1 Tax=Candidatus Similichlamydia laticola TaxID=2170265 RepID=A0A369KD75_9BACT|nr:tRNA (guanosine(37)-N1)-methyltransferase TrmD [Candidatus Similichlamydia laticola]RDB31410.1 tRNA (Guanine37-N1) -methyltransferase [Candidatus Similichlamydia laticola]